MGARRALLLLQEEVTTARRALDRLFEAWDACRPLTREELRALPRDELEELAVRLQDGPPARAKAPRKEDCARALMTEPGCQHLGWADLVRVCREAYSKRGLECKMTVQSMQWYPSSRGFMALPRLRIDAGLLDGDDEGEEG